MKKNLFKKLVIGIACLIIGSFLVLPIQASVSSSGITIKWLRKHYYSKTQSNKRYYTKTKVNNLLNNYYPKTNIDALFSNYLTSSNAASTYLSQSGGTLTGALTGTTISGTDFAYTAAQAKTRIYVANDFVPRVTATPIVLVYTEGGNAFYRSSGENSLETGVHLPNGAIVTGLTIYSYDNSAAANTLYLERSSQSVTGVSIMAQVSSSGSAGSAGYSNTSNSISTATIDNDTYFYFLSADVSNSSSSLTFRGAKITYTTTEP